MKQKDIFKKIGVIINELSDQYEYLQESENNLNDLELELFVANAHFLADHIEILCKLNLKNNKIHQIADTPDIKQEQKYFEPVVQKLKYSADNSEEKYANTLSRSIGLENSSLYQLKNEPISNVDLKQQKPLETYTFPRRERETIKNEPIPGKALNLDEEQKHTIDEVYKVAEKVKPETSQTADSILKQAEPVKEQSFENSQPPELINRPKEGDVITINEKISSQLAERQAARSELLAEPPISDIKQGITLNDKLLYVKDLFNGYNLAYSEAIEILNRFSNFDEASRFLKTNYVTKNNWESKPQTTEKFYALLKRRYT